MIPPDWTVPPLPPRRNLYVAALYFLAVIREFRGTLLALIAAILFAATLFSIRAPSFSVSLYAAWMALLAQPLYNPPDTWYLMLITVLYPVVGVLLIGEGIVRFALLMISRKHGEKEWMKVMASTYRDHVILCGIGHLGTRVLQSLTAARVPVVVLEKDKNSRFLIVARELGTPVVIRDMKEDQALIDAGVQHARAIIIATNDDMANLEVALDSRRLNPRIRVIMRLFDQQIASKISDALMVDVAFSSSTLAAPIVAAMSLEARTLSSTVIAGIPHTISELTIAPESSLANQRIDQLESAYAMRILARFPAGAPPHCPPSPSELVTPGDKIVIHISTTQLTSLAAASHLNHHDVPT